MTDRFALVPASYDWRRFGGGRNECEYVPLCFGLETDPLGSGKFVPRRPHHSGELEQAVARGLLPEQAEAEESDDE